MLTPETLFEWFEEYIARVRTDRPKYRAAFRRSLHCFQEVYEERHPDSTFVESLDRTDSLAAWVQCPEFLARSEGIRRVRLAAIRGFSAWLLRSGHVEHDAYFYVSTAQAIRGQVRALRLRVNLQPEILAFDEKLRTSEKKCWRTTDWVRAVHLFNLHRNRPEMLSRSTKPEELIISWLKAMLAEQCPKRVRTYLAGLLRFSEFVDDPSRVPEVGRWLASYRSQIAVIRGITQEDLKAAERQARFQSGLAGWFEGFLKFQGAKKMRLDCIEVELRRLDRVASRHEVKNPEELTGPMLMEFLVENEPAPATFNQRLARLRGFKRFLLRKKRRLEWPAGLTSRPVPAFRPHLYTLAEIGSMLSWIEATASDGRHHRFRWLAIKNIIFLLYAAGLRLREPLRLRLQDVDLERRLLFIDNTKFYKQRWVPLGKRTAQKLADYFKERCSCFPGQDTPEQPFFLSSNGKSLGDSVVRSVFHQALEATGTKGRGTRKKPRLHDLRHTAAVHKLYQWYAEGKDVQNKLPLLSAYLGHDKLRHTEVYLHLTEDLLRLAGGDFRASFEKVIGHVEGS